MVMIEKELRIVACLTALVPTVYVVSIADTLPIWLGLLAWVSSWILVWLTLEIVAEIIRERR